MSSFKVGDIVEIAGQNLGFYSQQGQVVAVTADEKGSETIHVWHGRECDHLLDHQARQNLLRETETEPPTAERYLGDFRTQGYIEGDLRLTDGWKLKILADRLFWNSYHMLRVYESSDVCVVCDRNMPAQKHRTFFNCWGTVMVLSTCDSCHRLNHGKMGDGLSTT